MRIIYLDTPTYLPGSWHCRIAALGEFEVFPDRPDPETAIHRLSACDIAIVEWTALTREILSEVRRVRHLSLVTTSFDFVDLDAAREADISVSYCPTYSQTAVAEHVFGLLLAVTRRLPAADEAVRRGESHVYGPFLSMGLAGRTLGLIGTGRTARATARIAGGFGMRVIAASRNGAPVPGLTVVPLDDLLRRSDVVSLHVPLNDSTRGLLGADRLALLKPSAVLINTCRGKLVEQAALVRMLAARRLAGAGLDDLDDTADGDIRSLDNVVLSPGTAWYTADARATNLVELYANLSGYLAGRPQNLLT
ncbi:NAD(P)-dependent oxidoreductase [Actinoplanes sp. NPDC051411]|uniref:2-hydroxyacid dehydrogenase n=1 Tax=Actinoplanes sp. NPDC051411 TaxID=3155522 RepID=UPI0034358D2E